MIGFHVFPKMYFPPDRWPKNPPPKTNAETNFIVLVAIEIIIISAISK